MAQFAIVKFLFDNTTAVVPIKTIINFDAAKVAKKKFKVEWVEEDGSKTINKAMVLRTGGKFSLLLIISQMIGRILAI